MFCLAELNPKTYCSQVTLFNRVNTVDYIAEGVGKSNNLLTFSDKDYYRYYKAQGGGFLTFIHE